MKERIILNKEKVISFGPKGLDLYSQEYIEEIDVIENTKKIEQVPDSFDDLKELCKGLKGIEIYNNSICVINTDIILFRFYDNGEIRNNSGGEIIIENRTPAQMWQIIKNLVENNDNNN